jgi:hypothetical protein
MHCVTQISAAGIIEKRFDIDRPLDLQRLDNGHVLLSSCRALVELDSDFKEVWRYSQKRIPLFSCQLLANGNILFGDATTSSIREIDRQGTIINSFDFPFVSHPNDYGTGFRLIRMLDNDRILAACYQTRKIVEFDWSGTVLWEADLEGNPYMPIRLPDGNTLVSLGPSGKIVEVSLNGDIVWDYDMFRDNELPTGWIAGISILENGNIVYSDSSDDMLVEISREKKIVSIFQDPKVLLHPSTHIII